jgi:hypothetical protein
MQTTNETNTYTIVMPIALPPLQNFTDVEKIPVPQWPCLAGALNSSEPIKKPQTRRTGDVENHLADSDFYLAIRCCRSHYVSFSPDANEKSRISSATFLTHRYPCVIQNSLPHTKNQEKLDEKKTKSVRHYSFGRNGCQYTSGRVSHSLLL